MPTRGNPTHDHHELGIHPCSVNHERVIPEGKSDKNAHLRGPYSHSPTIQRAEKAVFTEAFAMASQELHIPPTLSADWLVSNYQLASKEQKILVYLALSYGEVDRYISETQEELKTKEESRSDIGRELQRLGIAIT